MILGEIGIDMSSPQREALGLMGRGVSRQSRSAGKRLSGAATPGNAYNLCVLIHSF